MKYPKEIFVFEESESGGEKFLVSYKTIDGVDSAGESEAAVYTFSHVVTIKREVTTTKKRTR